MKLHLIKSEQKLVPEPITDQDKLLEAEHIVVTMWQIGIFLDDWTMWHYLASSFKRMAYYHNYSFMYSTDEIVQLFMELRDYARGRKNLCPVPITRCEELTLVNNHVQSLDNLLTEWGF